MMNIIMLKPTQWRSKFYSRAKAFTVSDEIGKRWVQRKIAILDPLKEEEITALGTIPEGPGQAFPSLDPPPPLEGFYTTTRDATVDQNNGTPTIKELKLIAKAQGIHGYSKMSKQKLTEVLNGNNDAQ